MGVCDDILFLPVDVDSSWSAFRAPGTGLSFRAADRRARRSRGAPTDGRAWRTAGVRAGRGCDWIESALMRLEGPMRRAFIILGVVVFTSIAAQQTPNPRQQPGATITMYAPEQHDLYDGHFVLSATRIYMVGGLNDAPGWDHMDNAAATLRPASGTVDIDVDEIKNTGKFEAGIPRRRSGPRLRSLPRVQSLPERGHRCRPTRARDRFRLWRQQLAEDVCVLWPDGAMAMRR